MNTTAQRPTVAVIGGGYGGVTVAKALDEHANVVLVEAKDAFQHNVAALRALVRPSWLPDIFLPYSHLLTHGTVRHDRAVDVDVDHVVLASGDRLEPDFLVLATGSTYPFPAKTDTPHTSTAIADYQAAHANLAQASRVMLLGAGPVGLELAGEIATEWPDKRVILVDLADDILPGPFDPALRTELHRQLDSLGVARVLGSPLAALPDTAPGEIGPFVTKTVAGTPIEADIWFRCFGTTPTTGYLTGRLAQIRDPEGYLPVTPDLRVDGFDTVYALGDIAAIDMNKAAIAGRQAEVVAANIIARLTGGETTTYEPGPPALLLPLGPRLGAGQMPGQAELLTSEVVSQFKGQALFVDRYAELMGVAR